METEFPELDQTPEDTYQVDPRLLERAMKRVKGLVRGNGADPETVTLIQEETRLQSYHFPARVIIDLDPIYGVRLEPGQNRLAELATSQDDFQRKIQNFVFHVKNTPEKRKQIVDFVHSRPDKGFGLKAKRSKFKNLAHDIVRHEQCMACSHSGYKACPRCQGKGLETCVACRGAQQVSCSKCHGSGRMVVHGGGQASCDQCRGVGRISCAQCGARGQMKCRSCGASGKVKCEKCSGTGWLSHLAHIELEAVVRFEFDRDGLPSKLVDLIEEKGAFLVSKGDIEVDLKQDNPVEAMHSDRPSSESVSQEPLILSYAVSCPYGSVHFKLGDKVVPAVVLGWQARLIDMPAFLEELTKPGIEAIFEAARIPASAVLHLENAARYAVWRSMLSQILVSSNLKKAMMVVMNRYSAGLHQETVKRVVVAADKAIRAVTRLPRYIGFGIGQALFSGVVFSYFYFAIGDRLFSTVSAPLRDVLDFIILPIGIGLGVVFSQIAAYQAQKKAFAKVVDADVLKGRMPRVGAIWLWSSVLSALMIAVAGFIL